MSSSPSLTSRAILAVVLMVGFYILALVIIAVLLFILYAMLVYGHGINRIALFALIGIGMVLWSIIPRPDNFIPTGPLLDPTEQPKFFETIKEIADATEQTMPVEIYLVPEINAWVANRGGVMGIGLSLLQTLTVSQFRAVVAHEFGHYYGGDTKLGPWVYKTRAAIGRTINNLSHHSSLLQQPFLWYGNMFLRITHAVSRQQEFAADALASQVVGARALVGGLKKIHGSAVAFEVYWQNGLAPVLSAGFHPPLADGFARYMSTPSVMKFMNEVTEKALKEGNSDLYDTHPTLQSRVEAVANLPQGAELTEDPPAISLLKNVPDLEIRLFSRLAQLNQVSGFKPLAWEDTGAQVYLPMWKRFARENASYLTGVTPASFSEIAKNLNDFARKFSAITLTERRSEANAVLGVALALALHEQGWELHTQLCDQAYFQQNDLEIYPFRIIEDLARGKLQSKDWQQQCEAMGISDLDLSRVVMEAPSS